MVRGPLRDRAHTSGDAEHRRRWSAAHGGASASSPLVRWWLAGVRRVASPLARAGVSPNALTLLGLVVSLAAIWPAALGGRWAIVAAAAVAASGALDGLDGAVAVIADRASARGAVLDAVADRLADAAGLVVLWLLGAPPVVVLVAGAAGWLAEYARARAQALGMRGAGAITVSERPTRVAIAAMFALAAGIYPGSAATWASIGGWCAALAATLALLHLAIALWTRLGERR